MGDRAQVHIRDTGVWLYTHWDGHNLIEIVQGGMERGNGSGNPWGTNSTRWNDPEYLGRIIFCELIRDDINGLTGYGIGDQQHGDVYRVIEISSEDQEVKILYGDIGKQRVVWSGPFKHFIKLRFNWDGVIEENE